MSGPRFIPSASIDPRSQFAEIGIRVAKPMFWHDRTKRFPKKITGASCFILKIDGRFIGITAAHVIDAYRSDLRENAQIECQIVHMPIDLDAAVIDIDREADIATFEIAAEKIDDGIRPGIIEVSDWPPAPPKRDDPAMLIGFPNGMRTYNSSTDNTFLAWAALEIIEHVTPREILFVYEPPRTKSMLNNKGLPPVDLNLSGASGGPVLRFERRGDQDLVLPIGVVKLGPRENESDGTGGRAKGEFADIAMVRASRLDCMRRDGTFSKLDEPKD